MAKGKKVASKAYQALRIGIHDSETQAARIRRTERYPLSLQWLEDAQRENQSLEEPLPHGRLSSDLSTW